MIIFLRNIQKLQVNIMERLNLLEVVNWSSWIYNE